MIALRRRARTAPPRPPKPISMSAQAAGSATPAPSPGGESTPAKNAIGGRLTVLPLSPQARKLSKSVGASAVRLTVTYCQPTEPW